MLHNTKTITGEAVAFDDDAYMKSIPVEYPDITKNDIRNIENCRTTWNLKIINFTTDTNSFTTTEDLSLFPTVLIYYTNNNYTEIEGNSLSKTTNDDGTFTYDVSSIIESRTIQLVCILPEVFINENNMTRNHISIQKTSDKTYFFIGYDNITIEPTRKIITEVVFNKKDNTLLEEYYNCIELQLKNIILKSNTDAGITLEASGITTQDAYLLMDNDLTTEAFSETSDADNNLNISYKLTLDNPRPFYNVFIKTLSAANAPQQYKFSGSLDDSTYIDLLTINQTLSVDDYQQTHHLTNYDNYKYYKIEILKGPTASTDTKVAEIHFMDEK